MSGLMDEWVPMNSLHSVATGFSVCFSQVSGMSSLRFGMVGLVMLMAVAAVMPAETPQRKPGMAEILAASKPSDWRAPDPENTLYMDLPAGRVVVELAPDFAPRHV